MLDNEAIEEVAAKWAEEVEVIYDSIIAELGNVFQEAGFLTVSEAVAAKINKNSGLDVANYEHIVDTSSIRHILKHHGTSAEYKRGQIPITKRDFIDLVYLLLDPDSIDYAGKTKQGRDVLRYIKSVDRHIVIYTEEVRTKRSRLAAITLYKRIKKEE